MIPFSQGNLKEKEQNEDNNLYRILSIKEILIEKLNDYGMNKVVENETLMQMFNLVLHGQQQKLLEGLYTKDNVYGDWIQCVQLEEKQITKNLTHKCFESPFHIFPHLAS